MRSIFFGTWQTSSSSWSTTNIDDVKDGLTYAIEQGVANFDTAPSYADGLAEASLGDISKNSEQKIRIMTKIPPDMLASTLVHKSINNSLNRLRVETIDTVFIHWPAGSMGTDLIPVEETLNTLEELRKAGKILNIGLSNFETKEIIDITQSYRIDAIQNCYSLLWRSPELGLLDFTRKNNIPFYAYSPVAAGLLFLRQFEDIFESDSDHRKYIKLLGVHGDQVKATIKLLLSYYDKNILAEVGIRWLLSKGVIPILGIKNKDTINFAIRAMALGPLDPLEVMKLDNLTQSLKESIGEDYCLWG